jgi:hypothetical protein
VAIFVTHIARALVFLETGEFLFDKRGVPDAFAEHCEGRWAAMVRGIHEARQGALPEAQAADAYRFACQRLTGLQNHFLDALAARGIDPAAIPG